MLAPLPASTLNRKSSPAWESSFADSAKFDRALEQVMEISGRLNFPALSDEAADRCFRRIKRGMPAEGIDYIGDIINGGWTAYRDPDVLTVAQLGGRRRIEVLNELLLKSIEVAELEARIKCC